jgi:hypothetical protein
LKDELEDIGSSSSSSSSSHSHSLSPIKYCISKGKKKPSEWKGKKELLAKKGKVVEFCLGEKNAAEPHKMTNLIRGRKIWKGKWKGELDG